MAISKEKKRELVAQYKDLVSSSQGMILATFSGMSVKDTENLRRQIREVGGQFLVVKNTLAKLAFEQAGMIFPESAMEGTTAIGFAQEGVAELAKVIVDAARQAELLQVKGGVFEGTVYDARQILRLADLPSLGVVQARLLGLLQAPASRLAGALSGSVRQVITVISAYAKSGA